MIFLLFISCNIYWPDKRTISVEQNVVFNNDNICISDNTAIIHSEAQSEGEKEKVIQASPNNANDINKPENEESEDQQTQEKTLEPHLSSKAINIILFPSTIKPQNEHDSELQDDSETPDQQYGHGHRT